MEEQEGFFYTIYSTQYSSPMTSFTNSTTINNNSFYNTIMNVEALPENILEDFNQWDEKKFANDNKTVNSSVLTNLVTMVRYFLIFKLF